MIRVVQFPQLRSNLSDQLSEPRSSSSSPTYSPALADRMLILMNRLQVLVLRKPKGAVFLLGIIERYVDRALADD